MDHDFEDIEVKQDAPIQLEAELRKKRKKCMIGTGAMCDPYIPLEETLRYTRQCLKIIDKLGFGLSILTKSSRILRDLDVLTSIHHKSKCVVQMTLTTFDDELCRKIEPHVSCTSERVVVLKRMADKGIPTIVWLSPFLPFINDNEENIRGLLNYCVEAKVYGVIFFGVGMTLREGNRDYYYHQLDHLFPGLRGRYERQYRDQYVVNSTHHQRLSQLVMDTCRQHGIVCDVETLFRYMRTYNQKMSHEQLTLL
jgi:DNA repair photolyase